MTVSNVMKSLDCICELAASSIVYCCNLYLFVVRNFYSAALYVVYIYLCYYCGFIFISY